MTDDEKIAAFIAARGVTRCPTAVATATLGVRISERDRAAHAALAAAENALLGCTGTQRTDIAAAAAQLRKVREAVVRHRPVIVTDEVRARMVSSARARWARTPQEERQALLRPNMMKAAAARREQARAVLVHGVRHANVRAVAAALGITRNTVYMRVKRGEPGWAWA